MYVTLAPPSYCELGFILVSSLSFVLCNSFSRFSFYTILQSASSSFIFLLSLVPLPSLFLLCCLSTLPPSVHPSSFSLTRSITHSLAHSLTHSLIAPRAHAQEGVKQLCCLSVCPWAKNIENTNNQLKYVVICSVVICSEKGTITTFELFFEGHSADSAIYHLWKLQIQSFLISYYSSPAPTL